MVLENKLESPLNCKEIKSINPKGNQSWVFIGRTDAEADADAEGLIAEANILASCKADSLEETLMLGKIEVEGEGNDRGWDGWMHHSINE